MSNSTTAPGASAQEQYSQANAEFKPAQHVGRAIAASLEMHGIDRVFTVPGESYLAVLDGLYESEIRNVVCRHEGGAAYMADAYGRSSGTVGVAMVTRGPGAANAFVAIHTAWQDAAPMILFVGLVPVADRDREAFQEFDPKAWFGTQAKQVFVLDAPERASEVVAEAFHAATSGRPGPVIVGLPEDVVAGPFTGELVDPRRIGEGAISPADLETVAQALQNAERPLVFMAGEGWTQESAAQLRAFAEENNLPVLMDWHGSWRVPTESASCIGQSAFGSPHYAMRALEQADLVLAVGGGLTDTPTDSYRLRRAAGSITIIASGDPALRGNMGRADLHLLANPKATAAALATISLEPSSGREAWTTSLRTEFLEYRDVTAPESVPGIASMTRVVHEVAAGFEDPIVTMGAGNHGAWSGLFDTNSAFSELGPRNGSMGYSIPAATAAALALPQRNVIAIAGDGEFLMNGQELSTAVQEGAAFLTIVMDNSQFGTIRIHQEREYPGRVSGTQLSNPDFAGLARAYGAHGETIADDSEIEGAVSRALAAVKAGKPALLHVRVDPKVLLPKSGGRILAISGSFGLIETVDRLPQARPTILRHHTYAEEQHVRSN